MLLALLSACSSTAVTQVHHTLQVSLEPGHHRLFVVDKVTLQQGHGGPVRFRLHAGLKPHVVEPGAELKPSPVKKVSNPLPQNPQVPLEQFLVPLPQGTNEFTLRYGGEIHHAISQLAETYARSFRTSLGLISPKGVFLAGSSYWYPRVGDELVTFSLEINLPSGWRSISQGTRIGHVEEPNDTREAWVVDSPQEEIYLVAGELTEYPSSAEAVAAMVFLRQPDQDLAEKYLEATAQYLALYDGLIGPYPYPKFALVENFWETGYGMPSFTLLGPKVIRLPFILHSSYPHEILHNWWGNGVYVDYSSGNWAEGLTSYLADHLIKEQRGQAVEYRRDTLQRYANYVREARDFPLTAFRGRHNATTEAVGYGKTLMLFHMLRQQLGDATFIRGLQELYRQRQFKVTGFHHVAESFEAAAGESLAGFFEQWVERTGAPSLRVAAPRATLEPTGFRLTAELEQVQPGAPYRQLQIPIAVHLEGKDFAYQTRIAMDRKRTTLDLPLTARPLRLEIDPEFDIFRRLDRSEIPPALNEAFGAERALAVLPASAPPLLRQGYLNLAKSWQQGKPEHLAITLDRELTELPSDQSVWLFGWENRFRDVLAPALASYRFADRGDRLVLEDSELLRGKHSVVVAARRPENPANALSLLATERIAALPGLARKLPHYGKYSYLGFIGDEPSNVVKGQWPVVNSPLSVAIEQGDGRSILAGQGQLAPRAPLAEMPPSPSAARMARDIAQLAAANMAGRGLGTPELDRAAAFIASEFAAAGLQPGGDAGEGYYQPWTAEIGNPRRTATLTNVIGILPGRNPAMARESVVIGAHYDHLGRGGPNTRQVDQGKIHPGADDNASGIAVLLELARRLGKTAPPARTLVFVAFTAEEAGRLGSQHYLHGTGRYPTGAIVGLINLDTVGRLGSRELLVLGSGSAQEWEPIFRGAGYVTGVAVKPIPHDFGSSDQKSFHDVGIPAVQLFAGTHPDFHRPTDTADKIDGAGLLKVLKVLTEAAEYLASRPDPLTTALDAGATTGKEAKPATSEGRRVLLGTVPDFAYAGQGVRLSGVTPSSPAAASGLERDDILVEINGESIHHLPDLSKVLQSLKPGAPVRIRFLRNGTSRQTTAHVVKR